MVDATATTLIQTIADEHLRVFAGRLADWLIEDLNKSSQSSAAFTESRARALLRAADVIDDPTLHSFTGLMENDTAVRVALHDLLAQSDLAQNDEVQILVTTTAQSPIADGTSDNPQSPMGHRTIPNLQLSIAAFAWRSGYPLQQLDPSSPPAAYSPAGQVLKRAAHFIRQQVQRSATERDKVGRQLAFGEGAPAGRGRGLDDLHAEGSVAPLPPHFRPPIPVRYPEVSRDTLHVDPEEPPAPAPAVRRGQPITITEEDLPDEPRPPAATPTTMPPIHITREQVRPPAPARPRVATPAAGSGTTFTTAVRQVFGSGREPMKTTKLRVVVQEYPDGPGLYGLQVHVTCRGVNSRVAGTTNREGAFLCELPVREHAGLTYNVDVTWPREHSNEVERKSITLNSDRTEFTLPFYRHLKPKNDRRPATDDR